MSGHKAHVTTLNSPYSYRWHSHTQRTFPTRFHTCTETTGSAKVLSRNPTSPRALGSRACTETTGSKSSENNIRRIANVPALAKFRFSPKFRLNYDFNLRCGPESRLCAQAPSLSVSNSAQFLSKEFIADFVLPRTSSDPSDRPTASRPRRQP